MARHPEKLPAFAEMMKAQAAAYFKNRKQKSHAQSPGAH
jgi:hypothetical protein